jgi:hypothetical protein
LIRDLKIVSVNGVGSGMDDKTIMDDGASVTEFDAENVKTSKEKARDRMTRDNIQKAKKA